MTAQTAYLAELGGALRVRGRARRRIVAEVAEHLAESAGRVGEDEAVARFGPAAEVAARFDAELATHRSRRAALGAAAALVLVAAAVVHLAHAAAGANASVPAALVFAVGAQLAAVAATSAVLQALRARRADRLDRPALALLARRTIVALGAGAATLAAAASTAGAGAAPVVLAGAVAVLGASTWVTAGAARLGGPVRAGGGAPVTPLDDALALVEAVPVLPALGERLRPLLDPVHHPVRCCAVVALVAAAGAAARDHGEGSSWSGAAVAGAVEAAAVVGCFAALGRPLGLRAAG